MPIHNTKIMIMKHLQILIIVLIQLLLCSCGTQKYLPVTEEIKEVIVMKDSVRYIDSVRVIPVERIVDIVPEYDTLFLETSIAKAEAYVDTTTHTLKGSIENKKEEQIRYVERIEYRERTDTLYVSLPEPYPVEVYKTPKWAWYTLGFSILMLLLIGFKIYLKIRPI